MEGTAQASDLQLYVDGELRRPQQSSQTTDGGIITIRQVYCGIPLRDESQLEVSYQGGFSEEEEAATTGQRVTRSAARKGKLRVGQKIEMLLKPQATKGKEMPLGHVASIEPITVTIEVVKTPPSSKGVGEHKR